MAHKITSQDQWFLKLRRRDPLQGSEFELGDRVVVCTKCKCVQTYDTWSFNENKCVQCGHNQSTDEFSREYIDFSYHKGNRTAQVVSGFRTVGADAKRQKEKVCKWYSQRRIENTRKANLWLCIILMILMMGMIYYWEHGSLAYDISDGIALLLKRADLKLQYYLLGKMSDRGIFMKLSDINPKIDLISSKVAFIQSKCVLLGMSFLYMCKKFLCNLKQLEWENKGKMVMTKVQALIDDITCFFRGKYL